MRIAVIPARGGSKRIPRKNIKLFGGKPMIAWSIEAALLSECFDRILVSTDDCEISQVAESYGAEVPFVRPPELSDDQTDTVSVISHAVRWQKDNGTPATQVCCIYATAPFLRADDLKRGLQLLESSGADYAFSVTSYAYPIQRAIQILPDQRVEMFQPQHYKTRSQDLVDAWHDAGQFYWGSAAAWLDNKLIFNSYAAPVILPRYRVQDIDTPADWNHAELMFNVLKESEKFK